MIVYFDTSAFIPLLVEEQSSDTAVRSWREASARVSSRLILVESAAAIAMGFRLGRLTPDEYEAVREDAWRTATNMTLLDCSGAVIDDAAELAVVHALRGYDATHLASAKLIQSRDVVFASGDHRLLSAASDEGFIVVDTSGLRPAP